MSTADPDEDELELIRRSGVALRTGKLCLSERGWNQFGVTMLVAAAASLVYSASSTCWSWPG